MEANEPSLYSRREKLSLQYAIRLAANPSNPAHEVTFPPNYVNLYEQKPKAIKSFGIRISPLLESANIKPQNIEKHFLPNIPAWCMKPPEILLIYIPGKNLNQIHTYEKTGCPSVREIWFFFKVGEKSGKSVKWSGKLKSLQKSGKSQGILKSCLINPSQIEQTDMS